MAIANVAELLYSRGLRVLMADFDLEAPGLEQFFDTPTVESKVDEVLHSSRQAPIRSSKFTRQNRANRSR